MYKVSLLKCSSNSVKILFLLSNTKYMYFTLFLENTKVQPLALVNSTVSYGTKESPRIALYNSTHIGFVTLPQCYLFAVDYGIRCTLDTPYKNLLVNINILNSQNLIPFYVLQNTDYRCTHTESYLRYLYANTYVLNYSCYILAYLNS